MDKTFNTIEAIKMQEAYCAKHGFPMYVPANGWCRDCGRNIFEPYTYRREPIKTTGISVEEAGSRLISGCPHCNRTFVD